jgi:hypothetical protein
MTSNDDRAALMQALEICRAESPGREKQIKAKLRDDGWQSTAEFAAAHCQCEALNLEPWQMPPCRGDSAHHPDPAAKKLLEQMLAAGVSRFDPDPLAAIEAARKGAT